MLVRRLMRRQPRWRRAQMWVPAPRKVIEPAAAGANPNALAMPSAFKRLAAPPVFVCGSARSGTTWTFDFFDRHPEVRAVNESWVLSQTHGLTSLLAQPYWDLGVKKAWQERTEVPFGTGQLVSYEEMARDLGELIAGWFVHRIQDKQRFLVAKEPIDVRAAAVLFPRARFLHVIRDGRDVALSMRRASESWDPKMGRGLPMSFRAEAWRRQVENIRAHRDVLGDRYLEVRYEEMRRDVTGVLRGLFGFAEVPYDDALLREIAAATEVSSYDEAGRRSGFRGGGKRGGWRTEMTVR